MADPDLSEFEAAMLPPGVRCAIAKINLTPEQKAKFDAAIARHDISDTAITRVLNDWGFKLSKDAVGRHHRGDCACARR